MKIISKFECFSVEVPDWAKESQPDYYEVKLYPVTAEIGEEYQKYWEATPAGELCFSGLKEQVAKHFIPGIVYTITAESE